MICRVDVLFQEIKACGDKNTEKCQEDFSQAHGQADDEQGKISIRKSIRL
jgi:hypothetical protein